MSKTRYIVVTDGDDALPSIYKRCGTIEDLLDKGYTIIASWTTNNAVHHILTKDKS